MKHLLGYFAQGCLALVPTAATVYILWVVIQFTDRVVGVSVPGLGLLVSFGLITLVGFLISNVIGRRIYGLFDRILTRVPVVQLLYTSFRDLLQTFVGGDKKSVGKPVAVRITPTSETRLLGLLTKDSLDALAFPDHVAVYIPQAYNIGGQVLAIPRHQVEELQVGSAEMLTFMMSGGASGFGAGRIPPR